MILNSTNCAALEKVLKSPFVEFWRGPVEVTVRFGGKQVDGLRIRPYPPRIVQNQIPTCADCGQVIAEAAGKSPAQIAAYTVRKYGRCLCAACAANEKDRRKAKQGKTEAGELNDLLIGS